MLLDRPMQVVTPTVDGDVLAVLARGDVALTTGDIQRRIQRYSVNGIRKALIRLTDQGIVIAEARHHATLYQLNRRHLAAPAIVALVGQREEFLTRLGAALGELDPAPIYAALFGSAARGEMRPDSDIDVFIVRSDTLVGEPRERWDDAVHAVADDASAWTGNDTRMLEMSHDEVSRALARHDPLLASIQDEGIRLHGPRSFWRGLKTADVPAPGSAVVS